MFRAPRVALSSFSNVARGVGRIMAAVLPSGLPCPLEVIGVPAGVAAGSGAGGVDSSSSAAAAAAAAASGSAAHAGRERLPDSLVEDLDRSSVQYQSSKTNVTYRTVPSTQLGRAAGFGALFAQLAWEKVTGSIPSGAVLSTSGHQHVVSTLCRMRGAVLKLGQMLSIQDSSTIPPHVTALFKTVRDQAFAMPAAQLDRTLAAEFHRDAWRTDLFDYFNDVPIAAASIGQVHFARLKAGAAADARTKTTVHTVNDAQSDEKGQQQQQQQAGRGEKEQVAQTHTAATAAAEAPPTEPSAEVAVKVQYPGVAKSIDSDVGNLKLLMSLRILPPGMFVDSILKELRNELSVECQYSIEAAKQERYRQLVEGDATLREVFSVPRVYTGLSTDQVLVSEFVRGMPIDQLATRVDVPQSYRDYLSSKMMRLTLTELFQWRFMQTDPNYANFLYDAKQQRIHLLDFGAARAYEADFVRDYLDVVAAAARQDTETIIRKSIALGFLTGQEVPEMINAHVSSVLLLGKPFRDRNRSFDFSAENLPAQIQSFVPVMVKLRLRPPPTPVYSLHRRLSGTILLATKFGATIPSGPTFWEIYDSLQTSAASAE